MKQTVALLMLRQLAATRSPIRSCRGLMMGMFRLSRDSQELSQLLTRIRKGEKGVSAPNKSSKRPSSAPNTSQSNPDHLNSLWPSSWHKSKAKLSKISIEKVNCWRKSFRIRHRF